MAQQHANDDVIRKITRSLRAPYDPKQRYKTRGQQHDGEVSGAIELAAYRGFQAGYEQCLKDKRKKVRR